MQLPLSKLLLLVGSLYISGCNLSEAPRSKAAQQSVAITVVGDETTKTVIDELAKRNIRSFPTLEKQAESSMIVVVQDSTVGPLPIHLEIANTIQMRPTEEYMWIFTNTSMVDDQELLELEELECREIFNSQGLPGDFIVFGFDSPKALVRSDYNCPKGWEAIAAHVQNVAR